MAKAKKLYTVKVTLITGGLPYVYSFDSNVAAFDFWRGVQGMPGIVKVTEPEYPTCLHNEKTVGGLIAQVREMGTFAQHVK